MAVRLKTLAASGSTLSSPKNQLDALQRVHLKQEFHQALESAKLWPLHSMGIRVFQVNVGKLCNQTCRHCHVDAGPDRQEVMSRETMQACLDALAPSSIPVVDITGGAPELLPDYRWFVQQCKTLGRHVMTRCNLTVIQTPRGRDLPAFYAENGVEVVCSLPHYRAPNTDAQRGDGVFEKSIAALKHLNQTGYGRDERLRLVLVTNPVGAFLPAAQGALEKEWKRELKRLYDIDFHQLYTITNMPISRYLEWLSESNNLEAYMQRLVTAFNPSAAAGVMCRDTISIDWQGYLYDCDFNQMLELRVEKNAPQHVRDFDVERLAKRAIVVGRHCYGCTAGAGSSCGGATA